MDINASTPASAAELWICQPVASMMALVPLMAVKQKWRGDSRGAVGEAFECEPPDECDQRGEIDPHFGVGGGD